MDLLVKVQEKMTSIMSLKKVNGSLMIVMVQLTHVELCLMKVRFTSGDTQNKNFHICCILIHCLTLTSTTNQKCVRDLRISAICLSLTLILVKQEKINYFFLKTILTIFFLYVLNSFCSWYVFFLRSPFSKKGHEHGRERKRQCNFLSFFFSFFFSGVGMGIFGQRNVTKT